MKHTVLYGILILLLTVCFLMVLFTGNLLIPLREILCILLTGESATDEWVTVVREFRLPKALTAVLSGCALSVSGLQMQTVFRNPLAGPFVLGISAGSTLGVALVLMGVAAAGFAGAIGNWTVVLASFLGAGGVLFLIFSVSLRIRDVMTILILGIMFGSITSSLINVLQFFSNENLLKAFTVWTMGSLQSVTGSQLKVMIPCILAGLLVSLLNVKNLNALLLGENYARSLGVNVTVSRLWIFFSTGILAGSVTAFCGPIGFIGIAVPHICRMLFRTADQRTLFFACIPTGAVVMLVSDLLSTLPGNGAVLPVNSVTAFIGIPVIIWIIVRNHKISSLI
ncbi:MAG: iron ABC transporter permease [Dysgonamonadaceae bacterium]|jgi:iron complex transport system permease protein|nr:iron ABC transporter permease [Dysgonamonadaceae bacterium]